MLGGTLCRKRQKEISAARPVFLALTHKFAAKLLRQGGKKAAASTTAAAAHMSFLSGSAMRPFHRLKALTAVLAAAAATGLAATTSSDLRYTCSVGRQSQFDFSMHTLHC